MPALRILIVKTSSFGDILHALPLADRLQAGFPDASIDWLVRANLVDLVEGHPAIDAALRLPDKSFASGLRVGRELRDRKYDIVIDAQGLFFSGWLTWMSRAPRRIGFDWNREGNRLFLTEGTVPARDRASMCRKILRFADHLGVSEADIAPQRWLAERAAPTVASLLPWQPRPMIALVIGASTPVKTLSVDRWISLAGRIHERGFLPVLVGGRGERGTAKAITDRVRGIDLTGQTSFPELAAVLDRCSATVGGDTGAIHLAASIGAPLVGLYGPTDPAKSGPDWGPGDSRVLDAAPEDRPRSFRRSPPGLVDRLSEASILDALDSVIEAPRAEWYHDRP